MNIINRDKILFKAEEEFYEYLYDHNGSFNPNLSAEKNDVDIGKYPNFYKNYNIIVAAYKSFDIMPHHKKTQLPNSVLFHIKNNKERIYRNITS